MHPRYLDWINHVFDHPVADSAWHWDVDAPSFSAEEPEIAELIELTFCNSATDLQRFTDAQLNQGLWYLASPACSDYFFALRSKEVPLARRLSAIASITVLYRDCFQPRCTQTLSHLDQQPSSPLNAICYMFWDICPISYLCDYPDEQQLADACFAVLADTFAIEHIACREAAIHGYGEFSCSYPERVEQALDRVLETEIANDLLREYAHSARFHSIQ
ncbi:MAG: hypothetical protein JWL81_269 [Verrucomicrobiales bacterium]|nr:hypothetical protein [Verrucomicrobiales bacterium]